MRKDYAALKRDQHYINAKCNDRKQLADSLKENGYQTREGLTEKEILESPFPVGINVSDKTIFILSGAAMAGAAAANDVILTYEEFKQLTESEKQQSKGTD